MNGNDPLGTPGYAAFEEFGIHAPGTWIYINDVMRQQVRETLQREPEPQIVVIDSQSVKTTEAGGDRGFDAGKKGQGPQTPADR